MIVNVRENPWLTDAECRANRRRVFVDGVEIELVWYVDTEVGIVKSYDVMGDGVPHSILEIDRVNPEWELHPDAAGPPSKVVAGKVELRPYDDSISSISI